MPADEPGVVRMPAIQHVTGSDFSIPFPLPGRLPRALRHFSPDLVHSHHPFMLGDTALRVAAARNLPVVFTYHTMYERYTHYIPGQSPRLQRFAIDLATGYCNLCDAVVAPSRSLAELLKIRGVTTLIETIPTGVHLRIFAAGDGGAFRRQLGIPAEAFVIGHLGRLAPEKNPLFLARAMVRALHQMPHSHVLLIGKGPSLEAMRGIFEGEGLSQRLHHVEVLDRKELAAAYRAMDVFAFASRSETQGMVLTEAMASEVPVVALDAPGVREVLRDGRNGLLLPREDEADFAMALTGLAALPADGKKALQKGALRTAERFSMPRCAERMLNLYRLLAAQRPREKDLPTSRWAATRRLFGEEWKILRNLAQAADDAWRSHEPPEP